MPYLSFETGPHARAIARVRGGSQDNQVLYLHTDDPALGRRKERITFVHSKYLPMMKGIKPKERTRIFALIGDALELDVPTLDDESEQVNEIYEAIKHDSAQHMSVELDDRGMFEILPNPNPKARVVFYICGQSGSGKSYVAKTIAEYYQKLFPERVVYLVSKLNFDETLDAMKKPCERIPIANIGELESITSSEEPELYMNTLWIFDDYDTLQGKEGEAVHKLIDDIAVVGRHTNTSMLCLSHYLTNYKKTRLILGEATAFVIYPEGASPSGLDYLMDTHLGLRPAELDELRELHSRWIMFGRSPHPQYVITQFTAKILHHERKKPAAEKIHVPKVSAIKTIVKT